jgi:hypothetical protein
MRAKVLKHIFAAIVAIATMGCSNDWGGGLGYGPEEVVNDADVRLTISGMAEQTRAIGAAGTAKAGDKMNSLTLLLVRDNNTIERRVDVPSNKTNEVSSFNAAKTEATVELKDVERGAHKIYLIANSPMDLSAYTVGKNVSTLGLAEAKLATLAGTAVPDYTEAAGMPMTAVVDVMFKQGDNNVSAEVERVVGRFGLNFYNHVVDTGYSVFVANAELSAFNASSGYLFNHDYTVPAGNTYRKFFDDASGSQKVPTSGKAVPFDSYLYETNGAATYNLSFAVGVFKDLAAGVTPTLSMAAAPDPENHNSIILGHKYLLYNANRNRYLYMNGNNLALSQTVPSENYNNYLWEFSTTNAGKIKNVGTGRWISRNNANLQTTNNEGSAETFTRGTSGSSMYLRSTYTTTNKKKTYYYFLNTSSNTALSLLQGGENSQSTNTASALWVLREMKTGMSWSPTPIKSYSHSAPLTFINDLGSPVPLTQIKRNENLQVGVNIFYNPQLGDFSFDVVPWTSVNGNVTFD